MNTLLAKTTIRLDRLITTLALVTMPAALMIALSLIRALVARLVHWNRLYPRTEANSRWGQRPVAPVSRFATILCLVVFISCIGAQASISPRSSASTSAKWATVHVPFNGILLAQSNINPPARALLDYICIILILIGVGLIARAGIQVADGRYFEAFASFVGGFILVMAKSIILYLASLAGISL